MLKINVVKAIFFYSLFLFLIGCQKETKYEERNVFQNLETFYLESLNQMIIGLEKIEKSDFNEEKRKAFIYARNGFKKCEPLLAFIDSENYFYLNQPAIVKVEEEDFTDIKIKEPTGFQVLEELLHQSDVDVREVNKHLEKMKTRILFLKKNSSLKFLKEHHILWIIRDSLNRVALTGITGFDSPVTLNSLEEASIVYQSIKEILGWSKGFFSDLQLLVEFQNQLDTSITFLKNATFEKFDRYTFIKLYTQESLKLWGKTVNDWGVKFPFLQPIQYETTSLFSNKTFSMSYFTDQRENPLTSEKIVLGQTLFEDTNLSKDKEMSCATCHKKELYFTDGLKKSKGTTRNSPTLFYAALQKSFFHDGRTGSLEGQIIDVANNPNEFHISMNDLEERVKKVDEYKIAFKEIYKKEVNNLLIRNAIASYIMSLTPFQSKFDLNMQGRENNLSIEEINGFNLFMGKAKCATCHFAPLFNGLVPTQFKESELESIGVPGTIDTLQPFIDEDEGRFRVYQTPERKYFFKTPTLRNIEKTGPYMHNGIFVTLEEVIDFYDKGGGIGIGLEIKNQTLPSDSLNLTKKEKEDLILFLKTLTDPL